MNFLLRGQWRLRCSWWLALAFALALVLVAAACEDSIDKRGFAKRSDCASNADCATPGVCWKTSDAAIGYCDTDGNNNGVADLVDLGLTPEVKHTNCTASSCGSDARCDVSGFCVKKGSQPHGAPCDSTEDCLSGLTCGVGRRCNSGAGGDDCMGAAECLSGFCQRKSDGIAGACGQGADGEACATVAECKAGPCNSFQVCGAVADGSPCVVASDCKSSACNSKKTCGKMAIGVACGGAGDCLSGFCAHSVAAVPGICGSGDAKEPCVVAEDCQATFGCNSYNQCGKGDSGAACKSAGDCSSGFCAHTGATVAGTCGSGAAKQPCATAGDCQTGLGCNSYNQCGKGDTGAPCKLAGDCGSGFCARVDNSVAGICGSGAAKQPCVTAGDCQSGLGCNSYNQCGKGDVGATCKVLADCAGGFCQHPAGKAEGVCGDGGDGLACSGGAECQGGFCNSGGTCGQVGAAASCQVAADCGTGFCQHELVSGNGLCGDGGLASNCSSKTDCQAATFCSADGKCATGLGSPCQKDDQCVTGCVYVKAQSAGYCKAVPDGKGCFLDGDCASGACVFLSNCYTSSQPVSGVCTSKAKGSPCQIDGDCAAGLLCPSTFFTSDSNCWSGYGSLDTSSFGKCDFSCDNFQSALCSDGAPGAACHADADCKGFPCVGDGMWGPDFSSKYVSSQVGKCGPPAMGEVCEQDSDFTSAAAGLCIGGKPQAGSLGKLGVVTDVSNHLARWPASVLADKSHLAFDAVAKTATSTATGLMWQTEASTAASSSDPGASSALYCNNLSLGGSTDWRVPTNAEFATLVDFSQFPELFYPEFGSPPSSGYFDVYAAGVEPTSNKLPDWPTLRVGSQGVVFNQFFESGSGSIAIRYRCVRDLAPKSTLPPIVLAVDGVSYVQNGTGLTWLTTAVSATSSTAASVCANLSNSGGGWRVPTGLERVLGFAIGITGARVLSHMGVPDVLGNNLMNTYATSQIDALPSSGSSTTLVRCVRDTNACDPGKCDDANACTTDGCGANGKCENKAVADGGTCGSGYTCKAAVCTQVVGPVCGDGTCDSGETPSSCSADCPPASNYCDTHCGGVGQGCYCDVICKSNGDCCDATGTQKAGNACTGSTCGDCN